MLLMLKPLIVILAYVLLTAAPLRSAKEPWGLSILRSCRRTGML